MYVCMYVCTLYMYVCMCVLYVCMYVCMYVCIYMYIPHTINSSFPVTNKLVSEDDDTSCCFISVCLCLLVVLSVASFSTLKTYS